MAITAIILTYNEERHIERAISSLEGIAKHVLVVDSFSSDRTVELAKELGADIKSHAWVNYATQFNWALDQLPKDTKWVFRLDADEYLTNDLRKQITRHLDELSQDIAGVYVNRRMAFLGQLIRHGGIFPIKVVRLFRYGKGRCENRWMDEHIKVAGETTRFNGELIDDNLNSLSWWIEKHNAYASREVVDMLNQEYHFLPIDSVANLKGGRQDGVKRWIKENLYAKTPSGARALVYFLYRYILRFGFLDGKKGTAFHFLQGLWYRYLVDAKLNEVKMYMRNRNVDVKTAIEQILLISLP